jgi:hypothetical protein
MGIAASPTPKRKRHIGRWIVLGFVGLIVVIVAASVAGGGGDSSSTSGTTSAPASNSGISRGLGAADATADVKIDKGSVSGENLGGTGVAKATLTITNKSSKRSDYFIEAALLNAAGENIGNANALVSAVEPGQVAHTELNGTYTGKLHSVKITQVQRTASV